MRSINGGGYISFGRVYRNNAAVGTERSQTTTGVVEYKEDIAGWTRGDYYQIYGYAGVSANCGIGSQSVMGDLSFIDTMSSATPGY